MRNDGGGFAFDDRCESSASDPSQKRVAPEIVGVPTKPGAFDREGTNSYFNVAVEAYCNLRKIEACW